MGTPRWSCVSVAQYRSPGGFGRSYGIPILVHVATQAGGYPNAQPQQVNQANPYSPALLITNGPPAPAAIPPLPTSGQLPLPPGVPFIYFGVGPYPHQYTDSWNVTIQHQLSRDVTFEIGYVANVARNIWMNWDTNMPPPGPGSFDSRRPYFQAYGWDQGLNIRRAGMASGYNSLQAKIDKRFSKGFSGNSAFTYGRGGLMRGGTGPMNHLTLWGGLEIPLFLEIHFLKPVHLGSSFWPPAQVVGLNASSHEYLDIWLEHKFNSQLYERSCLHSGFGR